MTDGEPGSRAIAHILARYPILTPNEALAFIHICADDGLSLKALSKRMDEGQSTVARYVTALENAEADRPGLVTLSAGRERELRRTVKLSAMGLALKAQLDLDRSA